jgi:hypothetical protein
MFNGTCGCTTTENEGALRLDTEDLAFDSAPTKIIAIERHWLHARWEEFYPMGNLLTSTSLRGRRCKPVEAPERHFRVDSQRVSGWHEGCIGSASPEALATTN